MCWDVTELVVLCLRDRKKGMPPGAHVGVHLFIWAGFACGLGWEARIFAVFECYSTDCAKRTASQWGVRGMTLIAVVAFTVALLYGTQVWFNLLAVV